MLEQALVFMVAVSLPLILVVEEIARWRRRSVAAIQDLMIMEERHA